MKDTVLCDIDGTVALMGKGQAGRRGPYDWKRVGEDDPNWPVIILLGILRRDDYQVVFVSGRKERCREQTLEWLERHEIWYHDAELFMRADDDNRPDYLVKHDIYKQHIEGRYEVAYVLDDRDQVVAMWRELGLTVLQVAEGNF